MNSIVIKNLTKSFKDTVAVDNLSLEVKEGELFSLLGVNGAGKSTTIKILTGLLKPDSGDAYILGKNVFDSTTGVKKNVAVSPQETAVAPNLTVRENLEFFADIYGLSKEEKKKKIEEIIGEFELKSIENKRSVKLSGGWQRRLSIAIALVTQPKVLFLDEPSLGLDVLARRELWKTISSLKGKITIILTTHYMEEAEALSDRVGVMVKGKLLDVDTPESLIERTNSKNFEEAFVNVVTKAGGAL